MIVTPRILRGEDLSHGDAYPVRHLIYSWVFCYMIPVAVVTWTSTQRLSAVVAATLAVPVVTILQGSVRIRCYRRNFGDAPLPHTPSHGVTIVHPDDKDCSDSEDHPASAADARRAPQVLDSDDGIHSPQRRSDSYTDARAIHDPLSPPLRLLVVGDSLAIGVGQAKSCTPVMPEAIAKTLSKQLGGRPVYWTCHGGVGASTGWIVRELERGAPSLVIEEDDSERDEFATLADARSYGSETDDSSIDDCSTAERPAASLSSGPIFNISSLSRQSLAVWRERLAQHQKRFDNPEVLGPYDIVVVMTGSNDLKSAFFPFLLSGEDAEFRRQAQERGGNYRTELARLLDTIYKKMQLRLQLRLQNFRHSFEVATETVREKVEETMERIAPGMKPSRWRPRSQRRLNNSTSSAIPPRSTDGRSFPLVVLPGLPARALPIFQSAPLRWLAVPVVDIMDMHKRSLATSRPGEVLFISAPSVQDLANYEAGRGPVWRQKCAEDVLLSLRDIRRRECRRIEREMREYYGTKPKAIMSDRGSSTGAGLFSIDQVHPCDEGYDFWGRYIANAILQEMKARDAKRF